MQSFGRHESGIERLYGHSDNGADDDSHGGYLNFGLWEAGVDDYLGAAENMVRRMGELLGLAPGARVVDAACGRGSQDLCLLRHFGAIEIDAVDVTRSHVEQARVRAAAHRGAGTVRFHHASATALPFEAATFSHAMSLEAAHHFDTREAFFREAARVLEPGGVLALADFTLSRAPRNAAERAMFDATCKLWKVPRDNADTQAGYQDKLARAGFAEITFEHVGARTFPGYYREQTSGARRRELLKLRGPVGVAVGEVLNYAAYKVWAAGLVEYVLVRAVKRG